MAGPNFLTSKELMPTTKELRRLDDLLRSELGSNPLGEPLYRWQYSENLLHPMWVKDKMDYRAQPSGIIAAVKVPVFKIRKLYPDLIRQWVMTRWMDPGSEDAWRAAFGTKLEYPRRGDWIAVESRSGKILAGPPDFPPTREVTEAFIGQMKVEQRKRLVDHKAELEKGLAQREKDADRVLTDRIDDAIGPFMSVPGKRGYHVSFPDPTPQAAN